MAVKHGPCWLISIEARNKTTWCRARSTVLWANRDLFGNCQETEICCRHVTRHEPQPLQTHPSEHRRGWATPWSAEERMGGHHQRLDIPALAGTAHAWWRFAEMSGRRSLLSRPLNPTPIPTTQSVDGLN